MIIEKKYFIYISLIAFIFYCAVNFIYFPLNTIFSDEIRFIAEAVKLVETGEFWTGNSRSWEMPFTAMTYSIFYFIFQSEDLLIISVRVFQSLLLIFQALLLYKISVKIFNDVLAAFLTFIVILFYPFFVYYQALLLSETLFNTSIIITFYFIYCWYESDFKINKYFILSNLFLVVSIYIKATLSLLAPLLLASFYFFNKYKYKNTLKILLYSILLYCIFLSPWWIRNFNIFNTFVPFTTTSALNLYLGNNPNNLGGGNDWSKDVDESVVQRISKIGNEVKVNQAYKEEAIKFIKENPEQFIKLAIMKLRRFYNIVPNAEGFNQGYYKWISIFSYGIIFILFLISIISNIKNSKKLSSIYILFIYYTLIHIVVIASLRYRLPLESFMILLSMPLVSKIVKYKRFK